MRIRVILYGDLQAGCQNWQDLALNARGIWSWATDGTEFEIAMLHKEQPVKTAAPRLRLSSKPSSCSLCKREAQRLGRTTA